MYKIIITNLANEDLEEIVVYMATNLKVPIAATNFLDEVEHAYSNLLLNPFMYEKIELNNNIYRRAVIKKYIMLYRVDENSGIIYISRFFHGTRNFENLL